MTFPNSNNPYSSPLTPKQQIANFEPSNVSDYPTISSSDLVPRQKEAEEEEGKSAKKPKRDQVKNACVNCQNSCKKCDDGRPCQRCIKYHLTETCQSSIRKVRKKETKRRSYHYKNQQKRLTTTMTETTTTHSSSSSSKSNNSSEKVALFKIYSPETVKEQMQRQQIALSRLDKRKKDKDAAADQSSVVHLSYPNSTSAGYNEANLLSQQQQQLGSQQYITTALPPASSSSNRLSSTSSQITTSSASLDHLPIPYEQLLEIIWSNDKINSSGPSL